MQRSGTVAVRKDSRTTATRPPLNARQCTFPSTRQNTAKPSPLGISINTDVHRPSKAPPKQIFPDKTTTSKDLLRQPFEATALKKAKPSLTLGKEVSPWDREIPICISPQTLGGTPALTGDRRLSPPLVKTPLIIVTPTEEDFGCSSPLPRVQDIYRSRIASSVYSPPSRQGRRRSPASRRASATTVFEEDDASPAGSSRKSKRFSLDSVVPTPRRSIGWWNLITSPAPRRSSTGSTGKSAKVRNDDEEQTPLLEDVAHVTAADSRERGALDDPKTRREIEESPFFGYEIPQTGEAATYYDDKFVFEMPRFQNASSDIFSTPESGSASRILGGDSPQSLHSEHYTANTPSKDPSEVGTLAKKVSTTAPASTPPKSSVAAVRDHFKTPPHAPVRRDTTRSMKSIDRAVSTRALPPEVSTANVQFLHHIKMPDIPASPGLTKAVSTPPARTSSPLAQDRFGTPAQYTPGYATVTRNDSNQAPPPQQSLPKVIYDPAATPEFYPPPASQPSTRPQSASESTRRLASPFETPAPYHTGGAGRLRSQLQYSEKANRSESRDAEDGFGSKRSMSCGTWSRQCWVLFVISSLLLLIVLLAVILAMKLTANHPSVPVEAAWLNLTGFPPVFTGISTVAGSKLLGSESGCVDTPSMWSCELPNEEQKIAPNDGSSPAFRIEILFDRDAIDNTSLLQEAQTASLARRDSPQFGKRGVFESILFTPYPSVPSEADQHFLGNNTDDTAEPYNGEKTPFYISVLSTTMPPDDTDTTQQHRRAIVPSNTSMTDAGRGSKIPQPYLLPNGTAPFATLQPYPTSQPLRLYNRGQDDEHFGFYTYFSRTIFMSSGSVDGSNTTFGSTGTSSATDVSGGDVNANGVATLAQANTVCTWSQTRFMVQLWTRRGAPLSSFSTLASRDIDGSASDNTSAGNSATSALDFSGSGTFPYPVTITLDRHGGTPKDKGVYCYGLDSEGRMVTQQKALHAEDRGFGGSTINPALGAFTQMDDSGGYGGVDGGDGGCKCRWGSKV